ncbi:MAG: PRC-barrel domain-containing protein [Rhodospirillaceae bacterium]|nr:PRC-barrel domain-containing protein [Rhodospirillaceae bacterium]
MKSKAWYLAVAPVAFGLATAAFAQTTPSTDSQTATQTVGTMDEEAAEATQECMERMNELDQRSMEEGAPVALPTGGEFRELREAALVFARNGNADACEMVIAEMQAMYDERVERWQEESSAEGWQDERNARLAAAQPVAERQGLVRADDIIGADIRNANDEDLGDVETIVLDPEEGNVAYVLVSSGGFLGMGENLTPVRWADLRVTEDGDTYVLNVTADVFHDAPTVNNDDFNPEAGEDWRQQIDTWWDDVTHG